MPDGNSAAKELVRLRTGREAIELLREMYLERRATDQEIAEAMGVHRLTVARWRRENGIRRSDRRPIEAVA